MGNRELALALLRKACEDDDTTLLNEAISGTAAEDLEYFYNIARMNAIWNNAMAILNDLISRGVRVAPQWPSDARGASKETLEFLLAQGWDINAPGRPVNHDREPFMWRVASDYDMVKWCLDHGASVDPPGQEPFRDGVTKTKDRRESRQILELVARHGSIATFELLRSKGAPLGWRPLHLAVEMATYPFINMEMGDYDVRHAERMAMVRYLLDVVGCDVNAPDQPEGTKVLPQHCGTPICYIEDQGRDNRELIWLLLDRGADPTRAVRCTEQVYENPWYVKRDYPDLVENVKAWTAWKKKEGGDGWEAKEESDRRRAKEESDRRKAKQGGDREKARQGGESKCCVQ